MDFILFTALSNPTHHYLLYLQSPPPPRPLPRIVVEITSRVTHKDYNAWI